MHGAASRQARRRASLAAITSTTLGQSSKTTNKASKSSSKSSLKTSSTKSALTPKSSVKSIKESSKSEPTKTVQSVISTTEHSSPALPAVELGTTSSATKDAKNILVTTTQESSSSIVRTVPSALDVRVATSPLEAKTSISTVPGITKTLELKGMTDSISSMPASFLSPGVGPSEAPSPSLFTREAPALSLSPSFPHAVTSRHVYTSSLSIAKSPQEGNHSHKLQLSVKNKSVYFPMRQTFSPSDEKRNIMSAAIEEENDETDDTVQDGPQQNFTQADLLRKFTSNRIVARKFGSFGSLSSEINKSECERICESRRSLNGFHSKINLRDSTNLDTDIPRISVKNSIFLNYKDNQFSQQESLSSVQEIKSRLVTSTDTYATNNVSLLQRTSPESSRELETSIEKKSILRQNSKRKKYKTNIEAFRSFIEDDYNYESDSESLTECLMSDLPSDIDRGLDNSSCLHKQQPREKYTHFADDEDEYKGVIQRATPGPPPPVTGSRKRFYPSLALAPQAPASDSIKRRAAVTLTDQKTCAMVHSNMKLGDFM